MAKNKPTVLRIRVRDKGKDLINLAIPLSLIRLAKQFIPKDEMKEYGIDLGEIEDFLKESAKTGEIVNFENKSNKTLVRVALE